MYIIPLKYVPQGEDRPRKCIETVRAWVNGTASLDEVREARRNSYAAAADAADAAAAYDAARKKALKRMADIVRKSLTVPTGKRA